MNGGRVEETKGRKREGGCEGEIEGGRERESGRMDEKNAEIKECDFSILCF